MLMQTAISRQLNLVIEYDDELQQYVGWCMGIPGAHSQASTIEELHANIREALELVIEVQGMDYLLERMNSAPIVQNLGNVQQFLHV